MKTYKIVITSDAHSDLVNIYNYISQDSLFVAEKFEKHLKNQIYALEMFPNAFPEFNFPKLSNFSLRVKIIDKDYLVIYEVDELFSEVIVHAIMHATRNIN